MKTGSFFGAAIGAANSQSESMLDEQKIFISRQWKNMSSPAVMHLKAQDAFS